MKTLWNWVRSLFGWKADEPEVVEPVSPYTITGIIDGWVRWTGPDLPWKAGGSPIASACAEAHAYNAAGQGGKFDWARPNTKERPLHNIKSGYWTRNTGAPIPAAGDVIRLEMVNRRNHSERIVIGEFAWK
jgi:hypothetical protein